MLNSSISQSSFYSRDFCLARNKGGGMTAKFRVTSGELPTVKKWGGKRIDASYLKSFWSSIGCGNRYGVYVFGYRASKGLKPLYVGQTKKQNFRKRIEQHVKLNNFDSMLKGVKKGTPMLFLLARVGKGKNSTSAVDQLELELINLAFRRNKNLHNDKGIKKPRYLVEGFAGPGKPSKKVADLKWMIGY